MARHKNVLLLSNTAITLTKFYPLPYKLCKDRISSMDRVLHERYTVNPADQHSAWCVVVSISEPTKWAGALSIFWDETRGLNIESSSYGVKFCLDN